MMLKEKNEANLKQMQAEMEKAKLEFEEKLREQEE